MTDKWDAISDEDLIEMEEHFEQKGEKGAANLTKKLRESKGKIDFAVGADIAQRLLMKYYGAGG